MVHINHPVDGEFTPTCTTVSGTAIAPGAGKLWLVVGGADVHDLRPAGDGTLEGAGARRHRGPRDADHEYDIRVYWVPGEDHGRRRSRPRRNSSTRSSSSKDPVKAACAAAKPTNAHTPG